MKIRRSIAQVFAVLVAVPFLAALPAPVAQADPIPPTNWSPISMSDMPGARMVMTDATGNVTVGCPQQNTPTRLFRSFNSSGAVVQDQPVADPVGSFCTGYGTVGRDSTAYVATTAFSNYVPVAQYVQAWKNNAMVWQYTLPCGVYGTPSAMTMGANGNLYMIVRQGSSPCSNSHLIGLTPTAQSGTSVPQVVMNQPINSSVWGGGLAAYNDGLVLATTSGTQYVSYAGAFAAPILVANTITSHVGGDRWFEATTSGRVFVVERATAAQSTGCNNPNSAVASIKAVDPNGVTWSTPIFTACTYVKEIHPTPSGGFAMRYSHALPASNQEVERVAVYNSSGGARWSQQIFGASAPGGVVTSVDLHGDVAVRSDIAVWRTVGGSTYQFPEINFALLSGVTGQTISQFALRGESSTTDGPSYMWGNGVQLAMAKNTLYLTAYQCTTLSGYCNKNATKLYAFTVPGLEMDYPRGAFFKQDAPWKTIVGMGDSFSSGQGASFYENGTDTAGPPENRCMRSSNAYPKLLSENPGLRLNLVAFVACGGSTTADMQNGRYGENPQLKALADHDPDLVTLTVGGNDIGFADFARACVEQLDCTDSFAYINTRNQLNNHLASKLQRLYSQIKDLTSSTTRVLVVGYPQMIVDPATNTLPYCPYLTYDEKIAARDVINDLNQKIYDGVGLADIRFEYVDPNQTGSPFKGHELCVDGGYFNGLTLPIPDSMHPNLYGQDAYRWVILKYLAEHP